MLFARPEDGEGICYLCLSHRGRICGYFRFRQA